MEGLRRFLEGDGTLILDGAMGTELDRRGAAGRCEANLRAPEAVLAVHRDYLAAGSGAIITNTLTMNRLFIEDHGLAIDVRAVNSAGARIAREACAGTAPVLGNLSSTGRLLEPYGSATERELIDAFREQAECLLEGGVDGFAVETMMDLREAVCAVRGCRAAADLPVLVCLAFDTIAKGCRTAMGNDARACAEALEAEGAAAVGANCGALDPAEMALVVAAMSSATRLPIVAEANAGKPRLENGATRYGMSPPDFALGMATCVGAGARIVGGCCGTTPAHIAALAARQGTASSP